MRPTDENQPPSRRPNLMSTPRRTSGEINILAMLDGQAGRSRRLLTLPVAWWYGGACLVACMLVGLLAWLARDAAGARPGAAALATAAPATRPGSATPIAITLAAPDSVAAAILDSIEPAIDAPPPAVVPVPIPVPVPAPTPPAARHQPPPVLAARPAPQAANHAVPRPLPRLPAHPDAPAPRARHTAAAAKARAATPTVDTDVALISAIILHGGGKRLDPVPGSCADGPCTFPLPERQ